MSLRFLVMCVCVIMCWPALARAQDHNFIRSVRWERSVLTYDYSPDRKGHELFEINTSTEGSSTARCVGFMPMPIGQYPGIGLRVNHRHGVDGVIISIADQRRPIKIIPMFIDQRLMFTFGRHTEITQVIESYGQSIPKRTLIGFSTELSSRANRDLSQRMEFFVQGDVYPFGTLRAQAGMFRVDHLVARHLDYDFGPSARVSWASHIFRIR